MDNKERIHKNCKYYDIEHEQRFLGVSKQMIARCTSPNRPVKSTANYYVTRDEATSCESFQPREQKTVQMDKEEEDQSKVSPNVGDFVNCSVEEIIDSTLKKLAEYNLVLEKVGNGHTVYLFIEKKDKRDK